MSAADEHVGYLPRAVAIVQAFQAGDYATLDDLAADDPDETRLLFRALANVAGASVNAASAATGVPAHRLLARSYRQAIGMMEASDQ